MADCSGQICARYKYKMSDPSDVQINSKPLATYDDEIKAAANAAIAKLKKDAETDGFWDPQCPPKEGEECFCEFDGKWPEKWNPEAPPGPEAVFTFKFAVVSKDQAKTGTYDATIKVTAQTKRRAGRCRSRIIDTEKLYSLLDPKELEHITATLAIHAVEIRTPEIVMVGVPNAPAEGSGSQG